MCRSGGEADGGPHSASVDLATDSKIQETIQAEFADRTLLCIARERAFPSADGVP
jgi:hypothetical protein